MDLQIQGFLPALGTVQSGESDYSFDSIYFDGNEAVIHATRKTTRIGGGSDVDNIIYFQNPGVVQIFGVTNDNRRKRELRQYMENERRQRRFVF
ncbi:MAG: hypothetical protein GF388_02450 [Candidatus Aegiribacteria sp.]|nr:hypothetical protein [Candidatus Aegiribacteria sp.]